MPVMVLLLRSQFGNLVGFVAQSRIVLVLQFANIEGRYGKERP